MFIKIVEYTERSTQNILQNAGAGVVCIHFVEGEKCHLLQIGAESEFIKIVEKCNKNLLNVVLSSINREGSNMLHRAFLSALKHDGEVDIMDQDYTTEMVYNCQKKYYKKYPLTNKLKNIDEEEL